MKPKLIAPCGMNCSICYAFLRENNKCPGCRIPNKDKKITCVRCEIKNCTVLKNKKLKYCSVKCVEFPCERLASLDKRYKTKYMMSMIDNLNNIDKNGIKNFIKQEEKRWIKGNIIYCVHDRKWYPILKIQKSQNQKNNVPPTTKVVGL